MGMFAVIAYKNGVTLNVPDYRTVKKPLCVLGMSIMLVSLNREYSSICPIGQKVCVQFCVHPKWNTMDTIDTMELMDSIENV
jgi:hypothetical protein